MGTTASMDELREVFDNLVLLGRKSGVSMEELGAAICNAKMV